MTILLHWYRNDIRHNDHFALNLAAEKGWAVLPIYVLPKEETFRLSGIARWGKFKKQFLYESLNDLAHFWKTQGSELLLLQGNAEEIIPALCRKYAIQQLSFSQSCASEEQAQEVAVEAGLMDLNVTIHKAFDDFLVHPSDLFCATEDVPNVFTQFRQRCEAQWQVRAPFQYAASLGFLHQEKGISISDLLLENACTPDKRSAFPFLGGEASALQRLNDYFFLTKNIHHYKETRNGMLGADYSSKFSPWLAFGVLSPRTIYAQLKAFEREFGANDSTYWLQFELLWRDYFRYMLLKFGAKMFLKRGLGIYHPQKEEVHSASLFQSWIEGKTGDDFVKACMHELSATGFLSNRGRQNVASYFVHQLKLDWRLGAEYFESQLIDYDPASNWGNWAYVAGVGNDPRQRIFNTQKQADQYDPNGDFRNCWNRSE
jgi:deoxyribodipyrimidine photo-lyase